MRFIFLSFFVGGGGLIFYFFPFSKVCLYGFLLVGWFFYWCFRFYPGWVTEYRCEGAQDAPPPATEGDRGAHPRHPDS